MTRIQLFTILSVFIIMLIAMTKFLPTTQHECRCVDAKAIRSRQVNGIWLTEFEDETGNLWLEELEEQPHLYEYCLLIDDNGTPDVSDDIVLKII